MTEPSGVDPDEGCALVARSAADYLARSDPLARARRWRDRTPGYDREAWRELASLGWPALLIPEADGGLGLGLDSMVAVVRAGAAASLPEPLTEVLAAAQALVHAPTSATRTGLLSRIVAGESIVALAVQDEAGPIDLQRIGTVAVPAGQGAWRITGRKRFVAGGVGADGYVVHAHADHQPVLFWVPADCPGLEVLARAQADGRFMADLVFADLVLPPDYLLASGEPALAAAWAAIDTALIGSAAELLGLSQRALDLTLDYLRTRTQFDRPIGAFQALQHRAVDLYIHQRIGESVMRQLLDALRHDPSAELRTRGASRVKARAARSARQITREAIQLHGAIGFTDDCEVGMHVRRALVLGAWLGSELEHRRRYARLAPPIVD
jgi:alkylation response protein AidB-like acyl-CoA dehydrogenase